MIQHRMNEVERLGRWQRIAPAFPAGEGSYFSSDNDLVDNYVHTKQHTWFSPVYDKMVYQSAPAMMCRNMPLPTVQFAGDAPYVMASHYPNGPVCVATEGRVKPEDQWFEPRARVTIQIKDAACRLVVDLDAREATLTVDGSTMSLEYSESMTTIGYVGFGVLDAETLFTEPVIQSN